MVSRNLMDDFLLMRNNSIQSRQWYNDQVTELSSDRVALIQKKLVVEEDVELGEMEDRTPPRPPWMVDLSIIQDNMKAIVKQKTELERLQTNHVQRPSLDEGDDEATKRQIEQLTQNITKNFAASHRLVQQIQSKGLRSNWNERRLTENVVKSTVSSLQDLSQKFRSSQGQYLRRITAREQIFDLDLLEDQAEPPTINYEYDQAFLNTKHSRNPEWTQQELMELEYDTAHLALREREVHEIVKSITDLNTIFRELGSMVVEQAGIVDRIDYNVEHTHVKVQEGVKHLQKASNYQKRNRKCVCLVSSVFLTILLIILLVAFTT